MSLPNLGSDPLGPFKDVLKVMIVFFVGTHRITTDEAILTAINKFMTLRIVDMNVILRELVDENKIVKFPVKVPLNGSFGAMAVYAMPGTMPVSG